MENKLACWSLAKLVLVSLIFLSKAKNLKVPHSGRLMALLTGIRLARKNERENGLAYVGFMSETSKGHLKIKIK